MIGVWMPFWYRQIMIRKNSLPVRHSGKNREAVKCVPCSAKTVMYTLIVFTLNNFGLSIQILFFTCLSFNDRNFSYSTVYLKHVFLETMFLKLNCHFSQKLYNLFPSFSLFKRKVIVCM